MSKRTICTDLEARARPGGEDGSPVGEAGLGVSSPGRGWPIGARTVEPGRSEMAECEEAMRTSWVHYTDRKEEGM